MLAVCTASCGVSWHAVATNARNGLTHWRLLEGEARRWVGLPQCAAATAEAEGPSATAAAHCVMPLPKLMAGVACRS